MYDETVRRAVILCLLLVACQNETNARLKKVEKELADAKANPPVEQIYVPVPTPDVPTSPERRFIAIDPTVAANFVHQRIAAYVSSRDGSPALVYQIKPGMTFLYQFDSKTRLYGPLVEVADIIGEDGRVRITDGQLLDLAHKVGGEPPKWTPGNSPVRQGWVEKGVMAGSGHFVPLHGDPMYGAVFPTSEGATILYRWDAVQALYLPIANVDPIAEGDRNNSISDTQLAHLTDLLVRVVPGPLPPKSPLKDHAMGHSYIDDCVSAGVCAFIPFRNDPMFGVVFQTPQQAAVLYRWDSEKGAFISVAEVDPIVGSNHWPSISEERMSQLQNRLAQP
ncbi:MAG: hypothetical protein QOC81_95 [Thermoanaerobaculia bacterium]|nr:hypothetical protein [Thermoanaerobaculia bacterium]